MIDVWFYICCAHTTQMIYQTVSRYKTLKKFKLLINVCSLIAVKLEKNRYLDLLLKNKLRCVNFKSIKELIKNV